VLIFVEDRAEGEKQRDILTTAGSILGRLPDRPISTFYNQDNKCDLQEITLRPMRAESGDG